MPNLTLEHTVSLTQQEILTVLAVLLGLGIAAMVVASFASRWRSLLAAALIFIAAGGVVGYSANYAYHALNTHGITPTNVTRLTQAVSETYGVTLTKTEAEGLLVGTVSYVPKQGQVVKFGTQTLRVHEKPYADEDQPVTLVWDKTAWHLLILSNGTYSEVQHA